MRVGMIGAGWIAQEHRRVLGSLAEAELVAICDLDRERAEALAEGTGARTYQDWRDLLDREDLGALIGCVPPAARRGPPGSRRSPPSATGCPCTWRSRSPARPTTRRRSWRRPSAPAPYARSA